MNSCIWTSGIIYTPVNFLFNQLYNSKTSQRAWSSPCISITKGTNKYTYKLRFSTEVTKAARQGLQYHSRMYSWDPFAHGPCPSRSGYCGGARWRRCHPWCSPCPCLQGAQAGACTPCQSAEVAHQSGGAPDAAALPPARATYRHFRHTLEPVQTALLSSI